MECTRSRRVAGAVEAIDGRGRAFGGWIRRGLALFLVGVGAGLPALRAADRAVKDVDLPYEEIAQAFLAEHGLEGAAPEQVDLRAILSKSFLRAPLGLFEVHYPLARTGERERCEGFRDVCLALLDAQERWLAWVSTDGKAPAESASDIATLRAWVKKWKPKELERAARSSERDMLEVFAADEGVRKAQARLREELVGRGGPLGLEREEAEPVRISLMPTRRDFVRALCFAGWWKPELRPIYWQRGIENWLEFHVDEVGFYAMEFLATGGKQGQWEAGTSLDDRNPTRLEQQIVQLGFNRLLRSYYGDALPGSFIGGLSLNLVIDLFGEVDTRVDGDLSSRQTDMRSVFVPGGRSEGGNLPPNEAGSRWRTDKGKDHFLRALRQAQKVGSKEKNGSQKRLAGFELRSMDESVKAVVEAPIFGSAASLPNIPEALEGEYQEFLRSYKCAFLHWLRTASSSVKGASERDFARFLTQMALPDNAERFEAVLEEVYGAPLSNAAVDGGCTEGRFLAWLAAAKSP